MKNSRKLTIILPARWWHLCCHWRRKRALVLTESSAALMRPGTPSSETPSRSSPTWRTRLQKWRRTRNRCKKKSKSLRRRWLTTSRWWLTTWRRWIRRTRDASKWTTKKCRHASVSYKTTSLLTCSSTKRTGSVSKRTWKRSMTQLRTLPSNSRNVSDWWWARRFESAERDSD